MRGQAGCVYGGGRHCLSCSHNPSGVSVSKSFLKCFEPFLSLFWGFVLKLPAGKYLTYRWQGATGCKLLVDEASKSLNVVYSFRGL